MGTGEQRRNAQNCSSRVPPGHSHGPQGPCSSAHHPRHGIWSRQRHSRAIAATAALCCAGAAPPGTVEMGIENVGSWAMAEGSGFETPVPEGGPSEESNLAASQHCWRRAIQPGSDIESESAGGQAVAAAESMPHEPQRAAVARSCCVRKRLSYPSKGWCRRLRLSSSSETLEWKSCSTGATSSSHANM